MKKIIFNLAMITSILGIGFSANAQLVRTIVGNDTSGYGGDGGLAIHAMMQHSSGMVTDTAGNLYISDNWSYAVRKITPSGIISTYAGNGGYGYSGDGGPATDAHLNYPSGMAMDAAGNLYIADNANFAVRKVSTSGIITTVAGDGSGMWGFSGDGGPATNARINGCVGLAVDRTGNLYIADGNRRIRKVNSAGIISTIAGGNMWGYAGDGGPATAAVLAGPAGIAVDTFGNVYFADQPNNVIRKINTSGIITTIAGEYTYAFSGDGGPATNAQLNFPGAIALDNQGNIYIDDEDNNRIRMVNSAGIISTVVGSGTWGYSGDGGSPTSAAFRTITAMCLGRKNNILVYDNRNYIAREVQMQTVFNINITSSGPICNGSLVTFTASGISCDYGYNYQWMRNGVNVGMNSPTYSNAELVNGDIITCKLTDPRGGFQIGYSNSITLAVTPLVAPSVAITSSLGATVCAGTADTYTAIPTNGGATPSYTWKVNGVATGTGSSFTYVPADGNIISVVLQSDYTCRSVDTAASPAYTMAVNTIVYPTMSITPSTTIVCSGSPATFYSTYTSGGTSPSLIWKVNGAIMPYTGSVYTYLPANADIVTCSIISSLACATSDTVASSGVTMTAYSVMPSVTINATSTLPVCDSEATTLLANPVNGGSSPVFYWKKAGVTIGTGMIFTYSASVGDYITCQMISNATCAAVPSVLSTPMEMDVLPRVTPSIAISAAGGDTLDYNGQSKVLNADLTNGGSLPTYQWFVNGTAKPGATSSSYTATIYNNDNVFCVIASNAPCAINAIDTSNNITFKANALDVANIGSDQGSLILFPNPTKGSFQITGTLDTRDNEQVHYEVYDVAGRMVYTLASAAQNGQIHEEINLDKSFADGQYFLRVVTEKATKSIHFVINK